MRTQTDIIKIKDTINTELRRLAAEVDAHEQLAKRDPDLSDDVYDQLNTLCTNILRLTYGLHDNGIDMMQEKNKTETIEKIAGL